MNISKVDKITGAIYGFAIGDAMGATTEFMTKNEIAKKYGRVTDILGGGWLNLKAGNVTDDTQMTLCVMEALMKYPDNLKDFNIECANNFVKWYESRPIDIGGQCQKGIVSYMNGSWIGIDEQALGNGSLMRAMPCALLNKPKFNVAQGVITHNNSLCTSILLAYSRMMNCYLDGDLYTYKVNSLYEPTGHIKDTFNNACYWSENFSLPNAIIEAVNHGGDADTIAAITGSLSGAKYGYGAIPQRWIDALNPETKKSLNSFINFAKTYLQI